MTVDEILKYLESIGSPENVAGMARYGIVTKKAYGCSAPQLHEFTKKLKKTATDRHQLAIDLWKTGIHDARAVAYLIDDPKQVTEKQMDAWVRDFDNWAICDSACNQLFVFTPFAYKKVYEWSASETEFIKRAGIVMMAGLALHDKKGDDAEIAKFLPILESKSDDDRNFIKKAVNWSLRQIGKRSFYLHGLALKTAERIKTRDTKAARWIAADAIRELSNPKTIERIKTRGR
jgi:3-methyladenine DNA glycosylase AlkD